jgi:hypothetical protein
MLETITKYYNIIMAIAHTYEFFVYWLPAALCVIHNIFKSINEYYVDHEARDLAETVQANGKDALYIPKLTVGKIIGRFIIGFIPVVNIYHTLVDFIPDMYRQVMKLWNRWLNIPLVPKRKKS